MRRERNNVERAATPGFQGVLAPRRRKLGPAGAAPWKVALLMAVLMKAPSMRTLFVWTLPETSVGNDPLVRQGDREDIPGTGRPA